MAVVINGLTGIESPSVTLDTDTLVIDADNNRVGIGTSSPSHPLNVVGLGTAARFQRNSTSEVSVLLSNNDGSIYFTQDAGILIIKTGGDASGSGSSEKMRIDSSGNVGIGTTSPSNRLDVEGSGVPISINSSNSNDFKLEWENAGVTLGYLGASSSAPLIVGDSSASEAMRIDSNGNLLIGTSTNPFTVSGANGNVFISGRTNSNSVAPLRISKQGDSGNLLDFQVNGGTVGTIFTSGGKIYLRAQDAAQVGLQNVAGDREVEFDGNLFYPVPDNTVTLGASSLRWKDLYLSGGVYLGGTGAANKLEDYETGTWTGNGTASSGAVTINDEFYTKIGDLVHVFFSVPFTSCSGGLNIGGLPFAIANANFPVGSGREDNTSGYMVYIRCTENTNGGNVFYSGSTGNASPFQVATGRFRISLTYHTSA